MSSEMLVGLKFQIIDLNRKTTKGSISQQGLFLALYQIDRDKPNHLVYKLLPEKWRDTKPVNIMFCIPIMFFGIKKKTSEITSVIWRTTSSLLRNLPSKRGARSKASIWKNVYGKMVIWSGGISRIGIESALGWGWDWGFMRLTTAVVNDWECWLGQVSSSSSSVSRFESIDRLGLVATGLNPRALFISWVFCSHRVMCFWRVFVYGVFLLFLLFHFYSLLKKW